MLGSVLIVEMDGKRSRTLGQHNSARPGPAASYLPRAIQFSIFPSLHGVFGPFPHTGGEGRDGGERPHGLLQRPSPPPQPSPCAQGEGVTPTGEEAENCMTLLLAMTPVGRYDAGDLHGSVW